MHRSPPGPNDRHPDCTTQFQFLATAGTNFVVTGTTRARRLRTVSEGTKLYVGFPRADLDAYHLRSDSEVDVGREIERKFLVVSDAWRSDAVSVRMVQGYLSPGPPASVRVRIEGAKAWLNIKESTLAIGRTEFEYPIPAADAEAMLQLCRGQIVTKTRHRILHGRHMWEVDVFEGDNAGLVVAEVELESEDESVSLPPWIGREVSVDPRYRNTYLAEHPFVTWPKDGR